MRKYIYILMTMVFAAACSKPAPVSDDEPMQMYAMTKAATDFGADTPVFLFWLATDFEDIGDGQYRQPYLEAWPTQEIDAYRTTTYNTGKRYPANDQEVWCTGYFPASLIVDRGERPRKWTALDVPADDVGTLDVMVAPEHITGKNTEHFETKEPKEPLVFIHAQSKISFKARMGTEMAQNKYLRNIKVRVPGNELMSSLKWENGRYIADKTAGSDYEVVLEDPSTTQLDPNQKDREIGNVYIYPGKSSLMVNVEVEMSDTPLFSESEIISLKTEIPFNLTDSYGPVLRENDAYEIILVINYDSIVLTGRKAEWEEGGGLLIPIYPNN
ncbi:MAG: hypothetical protein E7123_08180 [Bacteroidales bacterium]|nr:hypothetical protein [Bacteroidales bacterium]